MKLDNKTILVIVGIVILILVVMNKPKLPAKEIKKVGITDVFSRSVTNPGDGKAFPALYCGETSSVSVSGTLTDTDADPNNQFVVAREIKPAWVFTYGNFLQDAVEPTIISVIKLDEPVGAKTYSYTVTAPGTASTLSFSGGQYKVGEGQQESAFTSTGGASSLSCSVCTTQACAAGNNYCCNAADDNCNHDLNELSELTISQSCDKTLGVCAGSTKDCISSAWEATCPTSKYGANYVATETTQCDNYDNDCDGSKNEGMINTGANNALQAGVCAGSKKSCDATVITWFDDYSGITDYTAIETANTEYCDGKDNDCDNKIDEPKNGASDRDCSSVVTQTEIVDAINNIYGSETYFALGTFTSLNIGQHITAYYGAIIA